jgi:hypothetical protein
LTLNSRVFYSAQRFLTLVPSLTILSIRDLRLSPNWKLGKLDSEVYYLNSDGSSNSKYPYHFEIPLTKTLNYQTQRPVVLRLDTSASIKIESYNNTHVVFDSDVNSYFGITCLTF